MTLLELVAKNLRVWPQGYRRIIQAYDGAILAVDSWADPIEPCDVYEMASDWETAVVTEAKWKAARQELRQKGLL